MIEIFVYFFQIFEEAILWPMKQDENTEQADTTKFQHQLTQKNGRKPFWADFKWKIIENSCFKKYARQLKK